MKITPSPTNRYQIKMPVISATNFNQIAQWLAEHLNSEEIRTALLPENNIYALYVEHASKPKEKKPTKSKKLTADGIVTDVLEAVAEPGPKKKGGRKPKVVAEPTAEGEAVADELVAEPNPKKKGGRKPKVVAEPTAQGEATEVVAEPNSPKKKGGRKPKNTKPPSLSIEIPEDEVVDEEQKNNRPSTPVLQEDETEVEIEVDPLTYNGVDYLYDEKTNTVYDMESNVVGKMNGDIVELTM